jgi:hypothetical protein
MRQLDELGLADSHSTAHRCRLIMARLLCDGLLFLSYSHRRDSPSWFYVPRDGGIASPRAKGDTHTDIHTNCRGSPHILRLLRESHSASRSPRCIIFSSSSCVHVVVSTRQGGGVSSVRGETVRARTQMPRFWGMAAANLPRR